MNCKMRCNSFGLNIMSSGEIQTDEGHGHVVGFLVNMDMGLWADYQSVTD